jgi:hypothetical protein
MIRKVETGFSGRPDRARKRDEIIIRPNRMVIEEMEGVAGTVAPADGSFRGAGQKPAPFSYLPAE